ncbi:zinc finger protein 184-like [Osmerus eperlanus]|uniref:zinc finger protein 184-like n=1 Tax=Osmerus eperlanus TaxID=29151 RepID=UPI002E0E2B14
MSSFKEIKTAAEEAEIALTVDYHIKSSNLDSNFEKALDSSDMTLNLESKLVSDCVNKWCCIKLERLPLGKQARESNRTTFKNDPTECFDDFLEDFINQSTTEEPQQLNKTVAEVLILTNCAEGKGEQFCQTVMYKLIEVSNEENTDTPNNLPETSEPRDGCEKEGCDIVPKKNHTKIQGGDRERNHRCHICGRSYIRKDSLNDHLRTHGEERPYECPECGSAFHFKSGLKQHLRIHSDVKPYTCDTCGQTFHSSGKLSQHQIYHSDQRPHRCDECGSRFKHKMDLGTHKKIHTGVKPFSCTECEASFQRRDVLRKHMRIHTGERPYLCSYCGKDFPYAYSLHTHMIMHNQMT